MFWQLFGTIIPRAEKDYAKEKRSRELLERFYSNVFDTTRRALEAALENILGQFIGSSMLRVNPESRDGVMIFTFADKSSLEE